MKNKIIERAISRAGTQEKLAELMGVSQAAIHKLLVGKSKSMRSRNAIKMSKVTGIPLMEILEMEILESTHSGVEQ